MNDNYNHHNHLNPHNHHPTTIDGRPDYYSDPQPPRPPPTEKVCTRCYRMLTIGSFRRRVKSSDNRHASCDDCRREYNHRTASNKRQTSLNQGLLTIRQYRTVDKLWNLSQALIASVGGLTNLLRLIRAQILSDETTPQRRISGARALLHMIEIADAARSRVLEMEVEQLQDELKRVRREESPYDDVF